MINDDAQFQDSGSAPESGAHDAPADDAQSGAHLSDGQAHGQADALAAEIHDEAPREALAFDYQDGDSSLDAVPVTLSFELGQVSLPLGEVRTLGRGAVLQFTGGSPASVAIVAAGRTVGRGEIVDVDGQLGIRVTRWSAPL